MNIMNYKDNKKLSSPSISKVMETSKMWQLNAIHNLRIYLPIKGIIWTMGEIRVRYVG